MKKALIFIASLLAVTLMACANQKGHTASSNAVQSLIENAGKTDNTSTSDECPEDDTKEESVLGESQYSKIDIDLTVLNSNMTYTQVFDMSQNPENYVGKIVKMSGFYSRFENTDTGIVYKTCIIKDALGCCAQGIEFEEVPGCKLPKPVDETSNPEKSNITVIGEFSYYTELVDNVEYWYMVLLNAEVE